MLQSGVSHRYVCLNDSTKAYHTFWGSEQWSHCEAIVRYGVSQPPCRNIARYGAPKLTTTQHCGCYFLAYWLEGSWLIFFAYNWFWKFVLLTIRACLLTIDRGRKRHINIWHINNFSVTPVTDPPGRVPDPPGRVPGRKCLCCLGSAHST